MAEAQSAAASLFASLKAGGDGGKGTGQTTGQGKAGAAADGSQGKDSAKSGEAAFAGLLQAALAGLAGNSEGTAKNADGQGQGAAQSELAAKLAEKARNAEDIESFKAWVENNVAGPAGEDLSRLLEGLNQNGDPRESADQLLGVLDELMNQDELDQPSRKGLLNAAEAEDREAQRAALRNYDETDKIESEDRARYLVAFLALLAEGAGKSQEEAQKDGRASVETEQAEAPQRAVQTSAGAQALTQMLHQQGPKLGEPGKGKAAGDGEASKGNDASGSSGKGSNQPANSLFTRLTALGKGASGAAANSATTGETPTQMTGRGGSAQPHGADGQQAHGLRDGAAPSAPDGDQGKATRAGLLLGAATESSSGDRGAANQARFTLFGAGAGEVKITSEDGGDQGKARLTDAQRQELVRLLSGQGNRSDAGPNGSGAQGRPTAQLAQAAQMGQAGSGAELGQAAQLAQNGQASQAAQLTQNGQPIHLQQSGQAPQLAQTGESGKALQAGQPLGDSGPGAKHSTLPPSLRFALGTDKPAGGVQVVSTPTGGEGAAQAGPGGQGLPLRETYFMAQATYTEASGGDGASGQRIPPAAGGQATANMAAPHPAGGWDMPAAGGFSEPGGRSDGQTLSQLLQRSAPEAIRAATGHGGTPGSAQSGRAIRTGATSVAAAAGASGSDADPSYMPGGRAANIGDAGGGDDATQQRSDSQGYFGSPSGQQPGMAGSNAAWLNALNSTGGQAIPSASSQAGGAAATSGDGGGRQAPPRGPARQMAGAIHRAASQGRDSFTIRLQPPELGRVDVKMEMSADGAVRANLTAERADTLELLRQDSRALERALQEAGLKADSDSLNFSLKDQSGQGGQQDGDRQTRDDGALADANGDAEDEVDTDPPLGSWVDETGRVDVSL